MNWNPIPIIKSPIETNKYHYLSLPIYERWGILVNKQHPLANHSQVTFKDLQKLLLILPRRSLVKDELVNTLGININQLNIKVVHDLATNIIPLVRNYNYCAIAINSIERLDDDYHPYFLLFLFLNC